MMEDLKLHLKRLLTEAEECAAISRRATDKQKKELFAKLAVHLERLARDVDETIASRTTNENH
jgi:hypothetical protein